MPVRSSRHPCGTITPYFIKVLSSRFTVGRSAQPCVLSLVQKTHLSAPVYAPGYSHIALQSTGHPALLYPFFLENGRKHGSSLNLFSSARPPRANENRCTYVHCLIGCIDLPS